MLNRGRTLFIYCGCCLKEIDLVLPEFIQHRARPDAIAKAVLKLVNDQAARDVMIAEFDTIIAKLGQTGASQKAARVILEELDLNLATASPSVGGPEPLSHAQ